MSRERQNAENQNGTRRPANTLEADAEIQIHGWQEKNVKRIPKSASIDFYGVNSDFPGKRNAENHEDGEREP